MAREYGIGDRFVARSRVTMAPGFVDKMVERGISADEVRAVLASNEVFEVVLGRRRYGLVGTVEGRPLHLWVADDEITSETVLISVYQPDEDHGWSAESGWRRKERR